MTRRASARSIALASALAGLALVLCAGAAFAQTPRAERPTYNLGDKYHPLQGLAGRADRSGDGLVTVSELYGYVEDQVDRKASGAGGRQRPLMKGEIEGTPPRSSTAR